MKDEPIGGLLASREVTAEYEDGSRNMVYMSERGGWHCYSCDKCPSCYYTKEKVDPMNTRHICRDQDKFGVGDSGYVHPGHKPAMTTLEQSIYATVYGSRILPALGETGFSERAPDKHRDYMQRRCDVAKRDAWQAVELHRGAK